MPRTTVASMKRMVLCRDCRIEVSRSAKFCPKCGCRNPAVQQWMYIVAAVFVGVALVFAVLVAATL